MFMESSKKIIIFRKQKEHIRKRESIMRNSREEIYDEDKREKLIKKIFNYFINRTLDLVYERVYAHFALAGYVAKQQSIYDHISCMLNEKMHENQLICIKKLLTFFRDKIIIMKGILVAADLYGDINKRTSGDIDILINECDIEEVGRYLLDEGFECDVVYEKWLSAIKENHLVFNKTAFGKWDVMIEVHGKAFNPPDKYPEFTDLVWERAVHQDIFDMNPLLMDPYDRVVHYVLHYYNHSVQIENFLLMGINSSLKIKSLLDIYCTIKKYDLDFDELYRRVEEIHAVLEFYEVLHVLYNIFPDVCPEEFFETLKSKVVSHKRNYPEFWRDRIPLYETIDNFFSKSYCKKLIKFIEYDYTRAVCLGADKKQLFSYKDNSFACVCNSYVDKDVQFEVSFVTPHNKCLEDIQIVVHYHIHGNNEAPYINKITIDFIKEGEKYICKFQNGVFGQVYDLEYELANENGQYNLKFSVPKTVFENDVITYSVNFISGHAWDVCVSGETWIDFKTMRHLKFEAK